MTTLHIFVTYDPTDTAFATQLMTDLLKAGVEVITDGMGATPTLEEFLAQELPQCQHLIVVQTPEALQSPRVQAIVARALKQVQAGQMRGVLRVIAPASTEMNALAVSPMWAAMPGF